MAGRNQVDFITELLGYNCEQICKTICGYLSDLDLCRFASVSEKWRTFIKHDLQSHDRLRTYLSQRKQYCDLKGKENRGSPTSLKDGSKFPRMPLLDLHVNINSLGQVRTRKTSNQSSSTSQPSSESTQRTPHTGTYRPCPKCTSRSVVEVLDGYCHCQKCELKYCVVCLRDISYHNGKTCKGLREPQDRREKRTRSRKKGMDQVVGSKQTKERIRRL
ncbi:hypothetical protein QZH41_013605 [Actinostola sp. cb2023]|nr:hypothetical protein QZH41_013605 [Actinostola sp. cb2023]